MGEVEGRWLMSKGRACARRAVRKVEQLNVKAGGNYRGAGTGSAGNSWRSSESGRQQRGSGVGGELERRGVFSILREPPYLRVLPGVYGD